MRVSIETIRATFLYRWPGSHLWSITRQPLRLRVMLIGEVFRSWEPLLWLAVVLLAALILSIRFEIGQNADGLLQTLMSLEHLTVFFWEQDRFANLIPLLTSFITNPTANAQTQLGIRIVGGLFAPLLFCAPIAQDRNYLRISRTVLLATSLALAFAPHRFIHEWFIEASPYGTSFALGGFALLLLDLAHLRDGLPATVLRLGGLLLTIAAYMVNASLLLFTGPLFALLAVTGRSRLAIEFGIASVVSGIVTVTASNSVAVTHTALGFGKSFVGLTYFLGEFSRKPGYFLGAMFAIFVLSVAVAKTMRWPAFRGLLGYGLMLTTTFILAFGAISLSSWVIANDLHPRYLVPLYILAASLGAISIVTVFDGVVARTALRSRVALCFCILLLLMASQRSLPPLPRDDGIVDASVRMTAAAAARDLIQLKLDGIAGDYWTVWPTIFLAEQHAYNLGQLPGLFFGASYRGIARREALQTRLFAQEHLDFACLDLLEEPCHAMISGVVGLPLSVTQTLLTRRSLANGHHISAFRLSPLTTEIP